MKRVSLPVVSAQDYRGAVEGELWELRPAAVAGSFSARSQPVNDSPEAIAKLAESMLQTPADFPTVVEAIVPGDHVALAVDPNVPRISDVLSGVLSLLGQANAGKVSVVLWNEADDALVSRLQETLDEVQSGQATLKPMKVEVVRHEPHRRESLRYIVADENAEAVYLAKDLVDADFTLPILSARARDAINNIDPTGIFPLFADAATQHRYQTGVTTEPSEAAWLLGVQVMMLVSADAAGELGRLIAGTPDALRHELTNLYASGETADQEAWDRDESETASPTVSETVPTAEMVVAALDGDQTSQTWANLARAAIAAGRHVTPGGTIVIWSQVDTPPSPVWMRELGQPPIGIESSDTETESDDAESEENNTAALDQDTAFKSWDTETPLAQQWNQLIADGHVLLHCQLDDDVIESLGMGVIHSVEELRTLGARLNGAGVLRAAHYHTESIVAFSMTDEEVEP
ncbi:transcriptional regulator [Rhodopirellula bahusiensis]|uniref:Transcriptional regulator n=1 Tax=Rhodopirellula bahusiensis TaxID=2014065 RepID=A0A2G1VZ36_9BACT|nr:transcriptional regulator [Rhodopirellula bahusiensis]PHQ31991.1 transcriptional regulator [Rhodopirellula bahusiensis]